MAPARDITIVGDVNSTPEPARLPASVARELSRREALTLMASTLAVGSAALGGVQRAAAATTPNRLLNDPDVFAFSGAHQKTALTVSVIAYTSATSARVRLFAPSGPQVALSASQDIPASGITQHEFADLQSSTRYKYVPELMVGGTWITYPDEGPNGQVGWCWTMPATGSIYTRKVALLGCQQTATAAGTNVRRYSYEDVWNDRERITDLVHLGDFHYLNLKEDKDPVPHINGYKDQLRLHPYLRQALRVAGLIYTPSDHEAGGNNGESGGADWTLMGHEAVRTVFPMHPFLVPDLAEENKDLSRVIECGRMLWVIPDFRNYQRTESLHNFHYERENPGDTLKYRAYGQAVSEALVNRMDTWRQGGGMVVLWSDPVPYSKVKKNGGEGELHNKTDAYATYPATRAYLFQYVDEGIFSDYHNICDDDGENNLHGPAGELCGWFGCSGQWVQPTFRGGTYQTQLLSGDEPINISVYAIVRYTDFGVVGPGPTGIKSTKTGYQRYPEQRQVGPRTTHFL